MHRLLSLLVFLLFLPPVCQAAQWQAGTARVSITPREPLWLGGYADRTQPSRGVAREIYVRALALSHAKGSPSVLVSIESLGFPAAVGQRVADRVEESFGLSRDRLLLNASHTHSAPALGDTLPVAYRMSPAQWEMIRSYTRWTEDRAVEAIGLAIGDMKPARISFGQTRATHAVNRRVKGPDGDFEIGANRLGPVDHRVPVLVVDNLSGELTALVFGYACHNTTLRGTNLEIHGDYSGVAQAWLEERFADSVALFMAGAGGDANPYPRGTMQLAEEHGRNLALAVGSLLSGPLRAVEGPLQTSFETVRVSFDRVPSREELEERLEEVPEDYFRRRHARMLLDSLEQEPIEGGYDYPIQVWTLGRNLTLVALAGEVVVDYSLRLERELEIEGSLWVAGYSNDVPGYVPSQRILREGGYEADMSTIFYGLPARFAMSIEDTIVEKVREMVERLQIR